MIQRTRSGLHGLMSIAMAAALLLAPGSFAWALGRAAAPASLDRALDDVEMARVVGGGGGGSGNPIYFGEKLGGSASTDAQVVAYTFNSGELGPNASIRATFRVKNASGTGTWGLQLFDVTANASVAIAPADPSGTTVLLDQNLTPGHNFEIRVQEADGAVPRSYEIAMSYRYTLPAEPLGLAFNAAQAYTFANKEYVTMSLNVGPGQTGPTDLYLEDGGIPGTNVVQILGPDRIELKGADNGSGDLSFDNSEISTLSLDQPGEYLVVLSNAKTDITTTNPFLMFVGPYPGQDDVAGPCESVTAPILGGPDTVITGRAIDNEGDRDCFEFPSAEPFPQVGFDFNQGTTIGGTGTNEVRVEQETLPGSGIFALAGRSTGSGSLVSKAIDVAANSTASPLRYRVTVNNLKTKTFPYTLALRVIGPCTSPDCALAPNTSVSVDLSTSYTKTFSIRSTSFGGGPLALNAAASFQFDKTSSGTFQLLIRGKRGGVPNTTFCSNTLNADFFLENCDLTSDDGLAEAVITRTSGSGTSAIVRMGPDVVTANASPPELPLGVLQPGELLKFGEEDAYHFTLAAPGTLGLGFDDDGIAASSTNLVRVYDAANFDAALRSPTAPPTPVLEFVGTNDGNIPQPGPEATPLAAGDYYLVVDNDGLGTGLYNVCVGPSPGDTEDSGPGIPPFGNLVAGGTPITFPGNLTCGDTDYVRMSTNATAAHLVKIVVGEDPSGIVGNMAVKVQVLGAGGSWIDTVAEKKSSRTVTLRYVKLTPGESYRIVVDNDLVGASTYTITITSDD